MFNRSQIEWSKNVVKESIATKTPLAKILDKESKSYDDLRYERYETKDYDKRKIKLLEEYKTENFEIPAVSFFSGAGGLDLGLETSGFRHLGLYEKVPLFCETLKANRPDWNVGTNDVSNTDEVVSDIEINIGGSNFSEGIFVGGPPCQPFSIAANQRFSKSGDRFKRVGFSHETNGNLLFDYIKLIVKFMPRAFLIENVPGLKEIDDGKQLARAYEILTNAGYTVNAPLILSADKYNVPQSRKRLFIIGGIPKREFIPPEPTKHSLPCGAVFDLDMDGVDNHITRLHAAESVERYMALDYGCRDQLGRVDRLDPSLPSKTIIAGGTNGGGRSHLHPYYPRTLSVRESARLQTFPDDYVFTGPVARQFTQVGNAVPPVLAAQLGIAIRNCYF